MILQHLAVAERHVMQGEVHLARQEALIAELNHKERDVTQARDLLATLRETQALHVQHRDRILAELRRGR